MQFCAAHTLLQVKTQMDGTVCVLRKFALLDLSVIHVKKHLTPDLLGLCCLIFADRIFSNPQFMGVQKSEICMQNQSYFICQYKFLITSVHLWEADYCNPRKETI